MTDSLFGVPPPGDDVLTATGTVPTPPNFMPMPEQADDSWMPKQYVWSGNLAWIGPTEPWRSPYWDFPVSQTPEPAAAAVQGPQLLAASAPAAPATPRRRKRR